MSKEKVYWTTRCGTKMLIDDMTDQHVRNALKMLVKAIQAQRSKPKEKFKLNGDIAQDHIDQMMQREFEEQMGWEEFL